MATSQTTAHFFRVIYIILFVFAGLLVVANIHPDMFDFTKLLQILDYLTLLIQEGVKMMGSVAYSITLALLSAKSKIPFIKNNTFRAVSLLPLSTKIEITALTSPFVISTIDLSPK